MFLQSTKWTGEVARGTRKPTEGAHGDFPRLVTSSEEKKAVCIELAISHLCPHHSTSLPLPRASPDIVHQKYRAIRHDRQVTGVEVGEDSDIPDGDLLLGRAVQHCAGEPAQFRAVRPHPPYLAKQTHRCPPIPSLVAVQAVRLQMHSPLSTVKCFPATVNCRHFRTGGGSSVSRVLTAERMRQEIRPYSSSLPVWPLQPTPPPSSSFPPLPHLGP